MEVLQKDHPDKGMFYIEKDGIIHAQMTYVWVGTTSFIIDHTEVDETLKGMGAGKQMVSKAVDFARSKAVTIIPLCPFAKSVFDKVPEFSDVLSK